MRLLAILTALVALSTAVAAFECGDPTTCDVNAYCVADNTCECAPGYRDVSGGNGTDCDGTGFAVRYITSGTIDPAGLTLADVNNTHCDSNTKGFYMESADTPDGLNSTGVFTAVNCIYEDETAANDALSWYSGFSPVGVYRWVLATTSAPIEVPPTGLTLDTVTFSTSCAESGCWVLTGTLTTGHNVHRNTAFNTFYLPSTNTSDALSYDYDYVTGGSSGDDTVPVEWTFSPVNHPCTSAGFDSNNGNTQKVRTCCISSSIVGETNGGFLANYRTTVAFEEWADDLTVCSDDNGEVLSSTNKAPADPLTFLESGKFVGMPNSPGVTALTLTDPFFGQFDFTIQLDEVELRTMAGQLRGTVGVEHTIDTFLGLTNFRITGIEALDPFSTQVAIHLEKTSFFTVSTQGTNDYTFLEYVNLRLVTIYKEDADFSGTAESGATTVRTDSADPADYIQVTFTLGSQYNVNTNDGLIPLSSVRAGKGTFFDSTTLDHKCTEYTEDTFLNKTTFELRRLQSCAPSAAMCSSPSSIPDSFVSFNIPLGIGYYPDPSNTLSNNIFVDMVISAVDEDATGTPNDGDAPGQMKTTLTASIPVVEGGVNIFCDGYTAKTDLKDVANADIVVGSASSSDELTRLRIKANVASTQLSPDSITQIDSDSIEAGLMTLVIKGEASYFESNTGRNLVTVELEDVITIHIMESDGDGSDTDVSTSVMGLITSAPDDNSFSQGIDTDGYALNGAFEFTIDRSAQRAHLEPTDGLLAICPFNPPRPANSMSLETCVTRRDVRYRGYPARAGAYSTAMEICVGGTCPSSSTSPEAQFMVSIFGDNTFAKDLAVDYSGVISNEYQLNGRYRRAYWINPGYEWTPTQTGGTPIFSVSQKLYMFALITLDEALTNDDGATGASLNLPTLSRRRMLLQSTPDQALQDGESSLNAEALEFQTTPRSMMAKAFEVPEDRVATFTVTLQLTEEEACMTPTELQTSIRATLDDYLSGSASATRTVQVTAMSVDKAGVQCRRRSLRALLSSFSDATAEVTMMVVFEKGTAATISLEKLKNMAGVNAVEPLVVSAKVDTAPVEGVNFQPDTSDDDSSSNIGLIAGAAAGGAVAVIAIAAAVMLFMRRKSSSDREVISAVQTINVDDLKHQLANDA
mmetsp:Transcript_15046/g.30313  ORF Transcript_15046/g.30313 Transcript_15046/m.30313 type:complete len:1145 (+) Transcript_15046:57-3491(+)